MRWVSRDHVTIPVARFVSQLPILATSCAARSLACSFSRRAMSALLPRASLQRLLGGLALRDIHWIPATRQGRPASSK